MVTGTIALVELLGASIIRIIKEGVASVSVALVNCLSVTKLL